MEAVQEKGGEKEEFKESGKKPITAKGGKGKKVQEKTETDKEAPKVTKKSIVIEMLKEGATVEAMAKACTKAGLGDHETNKRTVRLWIRKIGFPVEKSEDGVFKKKSE